MHPNAYLHFNLLNIHIIYIFILLLVIFLMWNSVLKTLEIDRKETEDKAALAKEIKTMNSYFFDSK